jgi:AraC-like DNA-binding protein
MDPLSDVLRSVRLTGGIFVDGRFTAPWSVSSQLIADDCKAFLAEPAQIIAYHVVIAGTLFAAVAGEPAIEVAAGEIVLIPRNEPHTLSSAAGLRPVDSRELVQASPQGGIARVRHGGGGAATHIVCGFLASDEVYSPLIDALPRIIKLDVRAAASRDWIEASVKFAARELGAGRPAPASVMSRLAELLFVEAIRQYAATHADGEAGWLRGLRDPQVGRALALIHQKVDAPWSTTCLAREVALSRSAFTDRFTTLVGVPPIRYLTAWRLQTAKLALRETAKTIAQLAYTVGYASEEAFSRAFKREFGLSPAQWRAAALRH